MIKIVIELEIEGELSAANAIEIVGSVLDAGVLQDEINQHPAAGDMIVTDASCRVSS